MAPSHANGHGPSGSSPHEMRGSRFLELLAPALCAIWTRARHSAERPAASDSFLPPHGEAVGRGRCRSEGEKRFAKQTKWSSGPFRATNAASLGERPERLRRPGLAARRSAPLRRSSLSQVHWTCSRASRAAPHPELRRMGVQ